MIIIAVCNAAECITINEIRSINTAWSVGKAKIRAIKFFCRAASGDFISLKLYILEIVGAIVAKLVNHAVDHALSICSVCPCEARDIVVEAVP